MTDSPKFGGGPAHPDMFTLYDLILQIDGAATEGGRGVEDIVGEVADPASVRYAAIQRMLRACRMTELNPPATTQTVMAALWLEAFALGVRFERRRRKT